MISPLALWWRAANSIDPRIDYDRFVGQSVAPADLAVCAPGCDCRLRHALDRASMFGLAQLGFRVAPFDRPGESPAATGRRILAAIGRGTPLVCLGEGDDNSLIAGRRDGADRVRLISCPRQTIEFDGWKERDYSLSELAAGPILAVRRAAGPRGLPAQRNVRTLLEWYVACVRPPMRGGCVTGGPRQPHAEGIAAYDLWAEEPDGDTCAASRARIWRSARSSGAEFLMRLAGTRRTRFANRLRRAAEWYDEEAEMWRGRISRAAIEDAAKMSEEAAYLLGEAALPAAGLPSEAVLALLRPGSQPVRGLALSELLYLARAGVRPLRELSALRLAEAECPAATSVLMELLYDSDGRVASAALWSLLKSCEARLANALFGAARNGARCREGLDYSFALTLLIEAALLDHRIAGRVEDLRRSLVDEDPENPLILDCESALRATEPENPQRERGDDGE